MNLAMMQRGVAYKETFFNDYKNNLKEMMKIASNSSANVFIKGDNGKINRTIAEKILNPDEKKSYSKFLLVDCGLLDENINNIVVKEEMSRIKRIFSPGGWTYFEEIFTETLYLHNIHKSTRKFQCLLMEFIDFLNEDNFYPMRKPYRYKIIASVEVEKQISTDSCYGIMPKLYHSLNIIHLNIISPVSSNELNEASMVYA